MFRILPLFLALFLGACSMASTAPELQQLRIINTGAQDIEGWVILFPGPTAESEAAAIDFGTVPAGATTESKPAPSGVYRYAAYTYLWNGYPVTQPVLDWVGESPMTGETFTYSILLDLRQAEGSQIRLVDVVLDAP